MTHPFSSDDAINLPAELLRRRKVEGVAAPLKSRPEWAFECGRARREFSRCNQVIRQFLFGCVQSRQLTTLEAEQRGEGGGGCVAMDGTRFVAARWDRISMFCY